MLDLLNSFLPMHTDLADYKVHLATGLKANDPLLAFIGGNFKEWQEAQTKKNFERDYIVSLISYDNDEWLFAGIYKSLGCEWCNERYEYETELLDIQKDLIGRLIIGYQKNFRQSYPYLENCIADFSVSQILKERYSILEFPGYEKVIIDFGYLQTIFRKNELTWKASLNNMKGVYLICDSSNGKQYVGSVYGEYGFWSRWQQYSENGHGGSLELRKVIEDEGMEYAQNFQFSILEIRSSLTSDEEIIQREQHWKKALFTNRHGYNCN
jgi:hypothetical protein